MSTLTDTKNNVIKILFNYFNNIVFLDDKFDIIINNKTAESENIPGDIDPTMLPVIAAEEEVAPTADKATSFSICESIYLLMKYCADNNLNLFPYIYDELFKTEVFMNFVKKFPLLILDWELDYTNNELALELISKYTENKKLQYVIVYTYHNDIDNIADKIKEFFNKPEYSFNIISEADNLYQNNSTFITVMGKHSVNLSDAITKLCKSLIEKYGSLFVGFYDIINQANERTGEVLKDFMHPFEVLLSLQIRCGDNSDNYFRKKLTDIINVQIMSGVSINKCIGECINENLLEHAKKIKKIDNQTATRTMSLISSSKDLSDYRKNMEKVCNKFKDKEIWEHVATYMVNNNDIFMLLNTGDSNTALHNFLRTNNIELTKKQKEQKVLSMLLLLLLYDNIADEKSICKMIELVKLIKYDNDFCELIDLTAKSINKHDFDTILMNKYYCGDILINNQNDEFLLCINPPCDLFRPNKSDYCLKFLRGKKVEPCRLMESLKVSEHGSIIPVNEKPTVIIWSFNNEKIFRLNDNHDLRELKKYSRPFRMKEDYIKQIISKYSSFCMRMGVDEIFIKEKVDSIGKGFLSILK